MTPEFLTAPSLKQIGRKRWQLEAELQYRSRILGFVVVPQGFTTDRASVPRLPFAYWFVGARGDAAACVHDHLYQTKQHGHVKVSRSTADAVFYEALTAKMPWGEEQEPGWAASLMWFGVRVGGWWAWMGDSRVEKLNPALQREHQAERE